MRSVKKSAAAPPSASGNAGGHFEARVGAFYALAVLAGSEPRGLPGATATLIAFQQRSAGKPLDDVVVTARNRDGTPATLEIQAKRSMDFTPSDSEFTDVVAQIWEASQSEDFKSQRYELAVAIAKTTTRIERDIQQVLHWARSHSNSADFFASIRRAGFATDSMRNFVKTFRDKLELAGGLTDDETVWGLLRRFNILAFDFESPGSDYHDRARDRAALVLSASDKARSGDLWNALITDAEETTSAAGTRDRAAIVAKLSGEFGFSFESAPDTQPFLVSLADSAKLALNGIDDDVQGARLSRSHLVEQALAGLETYQVVEIVGAPGVGKSAVMKHIVGQVLSEGCAIVVGNGRLVGGGWQQMAHTFGTDLPSSVLFNEIAAGGGATVFVDNVDQIERDDLKTTLGDLLGTVSRPGWRAVVTAGPGSGEWRSLLPQGTTLVTVSVAEISDAEAEDLATQNETLEAILAPRHPAAKVARNLFFLRRIADTGPALGAVTTELDLARLWWRYGGGKGEDGGTLGRVAVLRRLAAMLWSDPDRSTIRIDDLDPATIPVINELLRLQAVRWVLRNAELVFQHDVIRDWAIGFLLTEHPELFRQRGKGAPAPTAVARALEIAARFALADDQSGDTWYRLLGETDAPGTHTTWRRPILLAVARSETAETELDALWPVLLKDEGKLLRELLRLLLVVESMSGAEWLARVRPGIEVPDVAKDFIAPSGRSWAPVVSILVRLSAEIPEQVIPDATKVFFSWLFATNLAGFPINAEIVGILFKWLALIDEASSHTMVRAGEELPRIPAIPNMGDAREQLRLTAFAFANLNPPAARSYMGGVNSRNGNYNDFRELMKWRMNLARAAPAEFADFVLNELRPKDRNDLDDRRRHGPFSIHDTLFHPAGPSQGPFLEILEADKAVGLTLIREIVTMATDWMLEGYRRNGNVHPEVAIAFPDGKRTFVGDERVYAMPRSIMPSSTASSALMALEAWGHKQIEAGRSLPDVLDDVLGPDGGSAALLAVGTDLVLSHWEVARDAAWPLSASPRLLELDWDRGIHDVAGMHKFSRIEGTAAGNAGVSIDNLDKRKSRQRQLMNQLRDYAFHAPDDVRKKLVAALTLEVERVAKTTNEEHPVRGLRALSKRALRMLDRANWRDLPLTRDDGTEVVAPHYVPDDEEVKAFQEEQRAYYEKNQKTQIVFWLMSVFDKPGTAEAPNVRVSVEWAKAYVPEDDGDDETRTEAEMARRAVVTAAAVVARDYRGEDREALLAWARPVLSRSAAVHPKEHGFDNPQVRYSDAAIATVGLIALAGPNEPIADRAGLLLPIAATGGAAVANALADSFRDLPDTDPLLRSLLRVLMVRSTYPRHTYKDEEVWIGVEEGPR